ncbi:MAG: hypothetical protein HQL14_02900 [Candidatus Omnitrophica bacterium]|nr:hypothetical protein [Candidatus Omnitrophota bacterium]
MDEPLTTRQMLTIACILGSPTLEDARRKANLSKGTMYRWIKDETFQKELKRQRDEIVNESSNRLKTAMTAAVDGLIALMNTPRPDLKRWVYKDIIEYSLKCVELEKIEERLAIIERAVLKKA